MDNSVKKKKHFLLDIPVLGPILGAVWAFILITGVFGTIGQIFDPEMENCIAYGLMIIGSIVALIIHKNWFKGEFDGCISKNTGSKRTFTIILIAFIVGVITNVYSILVAEMRIPTLNIILMALTAGFFEETAFRGIPISIAMRRCHSKGRIIAIVVITSVAFGLMHLSNISSGADFTATILQVISAFCGGMFYGAAYITTGNLLLSIVMHSIHDIISFCAVSVSTGGIVKSISTVDIVTTVVHAISNLICSILLLKTDTEEILAIWDSIWHREGSTHL